MWSAWKRQWHDITTNLLSHRFAACVTLPFLCEFHLDPGMQRRLEFIRLSFCLSDDLWLMMISRCLRLVADRQQIQRKPFPSSSFSCGVWVTEFPCCLGINVVEILKVVIYFRYLWWLSLYALLEHVLCVSGVQARRLPGRSGTVHKWRAGYHIYTSQVCLCRTFSSIGLHSWHL